MVTRRELLVAAGAVSVGCALGRGGKGKGSSVGGMVASSQRPASEAGVRILRSGGNAADAAVAVAAALNVTEPTSTGLGGDCFALYYEARTGQVTALNGSGRAPAALSLDLVEQQGLIEDGQLPPFHAHTVTVPGA